MYDSYRLSRPRQLDDLLNRIDRATLPPAPPKGWIATIRDALTMSQESLGNRLGLTRQAVMQLEKSEQNDSITLRKLRAAAAAMDCELVVLMLPRSGLETMMEQRAETIADSELEQVRVTMALEAQEPSETYFASARKRLVQHLLVNETKQLWK